MRSPKGPDGELSAEAQAYKDQFLTLMEPHLAELAPIYASAKDDVERAFIQYSQMLVLDVEFRSGETVEHAVQTYLGLVRETMRKFAAVDRLMHMPPLSEGN